MMLRLLFCCLISLTSLNLSAQVDDNQVLFTVDDNDVTVGEFRYIYTKTNADDADFSEASLREYLELYERFKLKVARAYEMGLDTVSALRNELAGYRRQLADNYLIDRSVTNNLVEELYERKQQDVDFSHILIAVGPEASAQDTLAAYQRALNLANDLRPRNFAEVAQANSDDNYSKERGGRIGFINAPMPNGFYELESMLYNAEIGTVVGPIRSKAGYHLVLVHERRQNQGEMEVAHIMVRRPANGDATAAREKIDRAYRLLSSGTPFEQVAAELSEDARNSDNGGYIGFFGINQYEDSFEDAAFALENDDDFSSVIETRIGFHIIRRISQKGVQPLLDQRPLLERAVKADGRHAAALDALLLDIRQRANVVEDRALLEIFARSLVDSTFLNFRWKAPETKDQRMLLRFGDDPDFQFSLADFQEVLQNKGRERITLGRRQNSREVVNTLYEEWIDERLMAWEESQLEERYPEFRSLMREYEEGILLFEATKMEVWDRAAADSTGLEEFFANHRDNYVWGERAEISMYQLKGDKIALQRAIFDFAATHSTEEVAQEYGRENLTTNVDLYEQGRLPQLDGIEWAAGQMTPAISDPRNGTVTFYKIERLLPGGQKELQEARGYVIADYQDQLEREWVEELRERFPIRVNRRVFNKLVRD